MSFFRVKSLIQMNSPRSFQFRWCVLSNILVTMLSLLLYVPMFIRDEYYLNKEDIVGFCAPIVVVCILFVGLTHWKTKSDGSFTDR